MARPTTGTAVVVNQCLDDIFKAANLEDVALPPLGLEDVLVKMLAAPINPSDYINIAGHYGVEQCPCPFVAGFEGVGVIVEVGSSVKDISVGDWIIPGRPNFGTWRDYGVYKSKDVTKVDKRMGFKRAATLMINPTTAYFLLHDVVKLQAGQTIIQNGANSYVGKMLIQIAKAKGIRTINVVRKRSSINELIKELKELGADEVVTDEDLKTAKFDPQPVLAIDCVGGAAGALLMNHLTTGGTLVSYGAMSGQPIPVSALDLVFRDIKICGYWLTRTLMQESDRLVQEALPFLTQLIESGKFKLPEFEMFPFSDFKKALQSATGGYTNKKQLLIMEPKLLE